MHTRYPSDAEWTQSRVDTLPRHWSNDLLSIWAETAAHNPYKANVQLRETTEALLQVRIPLDASDSTICEAAKALANLCASRAEIFHKIEPLRSAMERVCHRQSIKPPPGEMADRPSIARMCCPLWWRRRLRRHQGQVVEAAAIQLGHVNKSRDLYVSNERFRARQQQNERNAASLDSTIARNEFGQEFTLAELAATSPANKRVRRCELMTRISGFERIALDMGHAGLFMTLTCPSRFHRWRTVNSGKTVISNPNFDPAETPATAQKYLCNVWALIRSALARQGIRLYGFRIAEPQHDATPHWHFLVFCPKQAMQAVIETVREYALRDNPDEKGAQEHRCDFKSIDWSKGSAAGYIAKYVAKNIDGHGVGDDFNGKPATESAARVEAWATTWGIRQFQQVGGPPIGVWRELRRVEKLPAGAPAHLRQAHDAVNKVAVIEGRENASVAWDHYCKAQGGVFCGRDAQIKLAMLTPEKPGRYGDEPAPRPYGVETTSTETYTESGSDSMSSRVVNWVVESARHTWEIVFKKSKPADDRRSVAEREEPAQPWTCVNNCTNMCAKIQSNISDFPRRSS
ncbi:replication endonuclease [Curvibacter fontanus]